jgi:hypothetical protein
MVTELGWAEIGNIKMKETDNESCDKNTRKD